MANLKEVVLHHLEHTFEKEGWQPSLAMSVDGLSAEQAAWRPSTERHSIWQIVRHITLWKRAVFEDWSGRKPDYREIERQDWQEAAGDETAWRSDAAALHAASKQVVEWAQGLGEEELSRPIGKERSPLAAHLIMMATHDSYHAGQIRCLRTIQGA